MYNVNLSASAKTREEAITLFESLAASLKYDGYYERVTGSGGQGEIYLVSIGQGEFNPFTTINVEIGRLRMSIDQLHEKVDDL